MIEWITITALIVIGIGLVIVEIIFIPGTTIIGIIGFGLSVYGVFLGYEYFGNTTGHLILSSAAILSFVSIFLSFKSGAWKRFANKETISAKVNEGLTMDLKEGDLGESVSALKPIGKAVFNDEEYEVTSLGNFIIEKQSIRIIKIEHNKIYVELNT